MAVSSALVFPNRAKAALRD